MVASRGALKHVAEALDSLSDYAADDMMQFVSELHERLQLSPARMKRNQSRLQKRLWGDCPL